MVTKRKIVTEIILTIVTCGIYGIFWFINLVNDVNTATKKENPMSGGITFLLGLITCGIYIIVWYYQAGKALYETGLKNGRQASDNSLIYILLGIFGLGIVNYCLIQDELNKNYSIGE